MRKLMKVVLGLIFAVGMAGMSIAGSIDSPGAPSAGSGMYTLQNLNDYLTSGTALSVQNSFQEPTAEPGSTMKSTKEIGDGIKAKFEQCAGANGATGANVATGKTFFSAQSGSWGVQTGTALVPSSDYTLWTTDRCTIDPGVKVGGPDLQTIVGARGEIECLPCHAPTAVLTYTSCEALRDPAAGNRRYHRYINPRQGGSKIWKESGSANTWCNCLYPGTTSRADTYSESGSPRRASCDNSAGYYPSTMNSHDSIDCW